MRKPNHYGKVDAATIIENNTLVKPEKAWEIAEAIDDLYFEQLKGLIKALKILRKVKRRNNARDNHNRCNV